MNALHELLLMGAAVPDEPVTLAMAGVISLREFRLPAYRAPIVGLNGPEHVGWDEERIPTFSGRELKLRFLRQLN